MKKNKYDDKYYQPTFDGLEEWLEECKDIHFMTLEEFDEANKKLAEIEREMAHRQEWLEREYKFFAGSTNSSKFVQVKAGYYKEESEERLVEIFSRYFSTNDDEKRPCDVFTEFFTDRKMSLLRWNNMPSQIHLRNVYFDNPYRLKSMPFDRDSYKEMAKKVIGLLVEWDQEEVNNYVDFIERQYEKANLLRDGITMLSRIPTKQLLSDHQVLRAKIERLGEEYDGNEGHNSWSLINKIEKAEKEFDRSETIINVRKSLVPFEELSFRKDFTEEEYKSYQQSRKKKTPTKPVENGFGKQAEISKNFLGL